MDSIKITTLPGRGVEDAAVIAMQETWKNWFSDTTHQPPTGILQLLNPKVPVGEQTPRVCLDVSKLSDSGVSMLFDCNELLSQQGAKPAVGEFMVKTGLLA